jgi:hypothetical protein
MVKMKRTLLLIGLALFISTKAHAEPNMVLCWIFKMQGCPGVEPVGGNAINSSNNGTQGVGAIGASRSRVETRTIVTVPDYKIRRFLRSLGLGGQRINIHYELDHLECDSMKDALSPSTNTLFQPNNQTQCFRALQEDLASLPRAINLQVLQCQEHFCNADFIEVFNAFVGDHPQFEIPDTAHFLGCAERVIEI